MHDVAALRRTALHRRSTISWICRCTCEAEPQCRSDTVARSTARRNPGSCSIGQAHHCDGPRAMARAGLVSTSSRERATLRARLSADNLSYGRRQLKTTKMAAESPPHAHSLKSSPICVGNVPQPRSVQDSDIIRMRVAFGSSRPWEGDHWVGLAPAATLTSTQSGPLRSIQTRRE